MSDRFLKFYQRLDKFDFRALVHDWSSYGLKLANPANRRVTLLSHDGDQVETSLEFLEVTLADGYPVTFQLWLSEDTDITCLIQFLDDHRVVEEYWLDGLSQNEIGRFFGFIVTRFKVKAVEDAGLFVVGDREGYTIELNWDQLSLTGRYEDGNCPEVLGFPIERSADFRQCVYNNSATIQIGAYLIIMTKPSSPG